MTNFISIESNGYHVNISILDIDYNDIPILLREIEEYENKWENYFIGNLFWYSDNTKSLKCTERNDNTKIIVFR